MLGVGRRHVRPAVAGQVGNDQAEAFGQRRRHAVPHHVGLRIAVQQQQRRARCPPVRAKMRPAAVSIQWRRSPDRDRRGRASDCLNSASADMSSSATVNLRLIACFALHRPPADVAAAEAVRPVGCDRPPHRRAPAPPPRSCRAPQTLSTRPPLARMRPSSALVPAWKISTPSISAAASSPSITEPLA